MNNAKSQEEMDNEVAQAADAAGVMSQGSLPGMDGEATEKKSQVTIAEGGPDSQSGKIEAIDWEKVGKIYKPESAIEDIIAKEMNRLQTALDLNMEMQDEELRTAVP